MESVIIPVVSGVLTKLYDDYEDMKIFNRSNLNIEILKTLFISFSAIFLMGDIQVSLLHTVIVPTAYFIGEIDNDFWKSLAIIPFITSFLLIHKLTYTGIQPIIQFFLFCFITVLLLWIESKSIPEECSIRKLTVRCISVLVLSITSIFTKNQFIRKMMLYGIGYFIVSTINQATMLTTTPTDTTESTDQTSTPVDVKDT